MRIATVGQVALPGQPQPRPGGVQIRKVPPGQQQQFIVQQPMIMQQQHRVQMVQNKPPINQLMISPRMQNQRIYQQQPQQQQQMGSNQQQASPMASSPSNVMYQQQPQQQQGPMQNSNPQIYHVQSDVQSPITFEQNPAGQQFGTLELSSNSPQGMLGAKNSDFVRQELRKKLNSTGVSTNGRPGSVGGVVPGQLMRNQMLGPSGMNGVGGQMMAPADSPVMVTGNQGGVGSSSGMNNGGPSSSAAMASSSLNDLDLQMLEQYSDLADQPGSMDIFDGMNSGSSMSGNQGQGGPINRNNSIVSILTFHDSSS